MCLSYDLYFDLHSSLNTYISDNLSSFARCGRMILKNTPKDAREKDDRRRDLNTARCCNAESSGAWYKAWDAIGPQTGDQPDQWQGTRCDESG